MTGKDCRRLAHLSPGVGARQRQEGVGRRLPPRRSAPLARTYASTHAMILMTILDKAASQIRLWSIPGGPIS